VNRLRRFPYRTILFLLCLAGIFYAGRSVWLPLLARPLIHEEDPVKAEVAVVLAGDLRGNRIRKAAELARAGYVKEVIVSGPVGMYGVHENDLAIPYMVQLGYPAKLFVPLPHSAHSTREEAAVILRELERRKIKSFILVTSDYHTARSARIYRATERALGGGPAMRVVAAQDTHFTRETWWKSREGLKTVFMEWSKTVATAFGV